MSNKPLAAEPEWDLSISIEHDRTIAGSAAPGLRSWNLRYRDCHGEQSMSGYGTPAVLPVLRPDNVPESAIPFVGWVERNCTFDHHSVRSPTGDAFWHPSTEMLTAYGLPIPPVPPKPTLAEQLRTDAEAIRAEPGAGWNVTEQERADRLDAAADRLAELENT